MQTIDTLFCVTLHDYPHDLPDKARETAQSRYAKTLERQLGGAEVVAEALDTLLRLQDTSPEEVSADDLALLRRWSRATQAAREAALRDLGDAETAYFEVELT